MKKTAVAAALTALAVPAAAQAHRPDDAGERGLATAEQKRAGHDKTKDARGTQRVGFALSGVGVTGLSASEGKLTGPFTLDPTSANKAARKLLEIDRTFIKGTETTSVPAVAGDEVKLRLVGLTDASQIQPTDRVKVIGKVTRDGELNIRKITVKRPDEDTDQS